jgi:hypothetical protein
MATRAIRLLVVSLVFLAPMAVQLTLFGQNCPNTAPMTVACPDHFPVCAGPQPCQGNGSVVQTGNWDCQPAPDTYCHTSANPDQGALCYTVYGCFWNGQACVPNTNVQGQPFNKIAKVQTRCPDNP